MMKISYLFYFIKWAQSSGHYLSDSLYKDLKKKFYNCHANIEENIKNHAMSLYITYKY